SVRLGSGGLGVGSGGVTCVEALMISGFSTTLVAGLSDSLVSPSFSTSGLGASVFGSFLAPARNFENSATEPTSTASAGAASRAFDENQSRPHSSAATSTAACPAADMVRRLLI